MIRKDVILPAVQHMPGLAIVYRKRLRGLLEQMHRSVVYWVLAAYRQNEPRIVGLAQDAAPADALNKIMQELGKRWRSRFDDSSKDLAAYFAQATSKRTDAQLRAILKKAGFTIPYKLTKAQQDVFKATVNENVGLIKTIPEQYLSKVNGAVTRAIQAGHDVGALKKELEHGYGITERRASLIARDQTRKATAAFTRVRQLEVGATEAIWMHSHAGKQPRPSHVKAGRDKVRYNIAEGWYDPDEDKYIVPGELINCRCSSKTIIPGFML